ncbi:MAG: hypothetical protein II998_06130 [Clostridia bacterium]|nr:hypothetical protein [Clostridia bacterium]
MKRKIMKLTGLILCLTLAMFAFAACSNDSKKADGSSEKKNPIVGTWGFETNSEWEYKFNADGTGSYTFGGEPMTFTYEDDGKEIRLKYDHADNVNVYKYTIDGDTLNIEDDFGEVTVFKKK